MKIICFDVFFNRFCIGTSSYVAGEDRIHEVTTLIGISWKGEPIAGVMNQPFSTRKINDSNCDRMIWAICGFGKCPPE